MINQEMRTLNLSRIDVLDIKRAIKFVNLAMRDELRDANTTKDRREVLMKSINRVEALYAEVARQLAEQDPKDI